MRRTNIYLDDRQTATLDRLAEQEGLSRAELIRRLLSRALSTADESLESDIAAIKESFGALRNIEMPVRGPTDREEHLACSWRGTS